MTTVVNIHHLDSKDHISNYVYIGRKKGTICHYGNPFPIGKEGNREEVIEKCERWLRGIGFNDFCQAQRAWILKNLAKLDGETLTCFCKPLPCHGDIYVKLLNEMREKDV